MRKYLKITWLTFINGFQYRSEILISLIVGLVIFAGQAIFWHAAFVGRDEVNGFSFAGIIFYFLVSRIVSDVTYSDLARKTSDFIISGRISNLVIKPLSLRVWLFFEEFGSVILRVIAKMIVFTVIYVAIFGGIETTILSFISFLVALALSFTLSFCIYFIIGSLGFWIENTRSLSWSIRRIVYFLAGGILPLSFFPEPFQKVVNVLPFKYIFDFPVKNLAVGLEMKELVVGVLIQLGWIAVLWILASFVLRKAIKSNESVGI